MKNHRYTLRLLAGLTALALNPALVLAAPPAAPTELRVDDVAEPVGVGGAPYFGWLVNDPDADEIQTKYRILVATSAADLAAGTQPVWDSGPVEGRSQNHIEYGGPALAPDTRYFWQVCTWDRAGNAGPFSAPGSFVVGPLTNADWAGAAWIKRETDVADDYTFYRKPFALPDKPILQATVYITSVHKYALYVNGTLVGKGPAYHYPQYQYYNAWDVTALLTAGKPNLFSVFNHWFGGGQGRATSSRGLLVRAVIHFADGTSTVIGTDGTWKQSAAECWIGGPRQRGGEGVGYVERFDGGRVVPDWFQPAFDDSAWAPATVIGPQPIAPWTGSRAPDLSRIEETVIAPVSVSDKGGGKFVVDFGKVYAGVPRLSLPGGRPGTEVRLLGGFGLDAAGEIDPKQNQHTDLSWQVVLAEKSFVFEAAEYLGFRYLQIENAPEPPTAANCRLVARHSRLETERSAFDSDNPTLNAVWRLMKHSLTVCAQEEFVDTPTREKGGFLGDSIFQSIAAMPVMHERILTRRALGEFLQSMDQFWATPANRGRINAVYPNVDGARDIPDNTLAFPVWAWEYYLETGDRAFLGLAYERLKAVADYAWRARDSATGLVTDLPGGKGAYRGGIIDWPPSMRYGYDTATTARTVVQALACADQELLACIANELGRTGDRELYQVRATELREALNQPLLRAPDGAYLDGLRAGVVPSGHVSQQANSVPLAFGLVPANRRAAVVAKVKELQMRSGMETVLWLMRALGESGEGEPLLALYTNPEWPGWARSLSLGATSTWESWDAETSGDSQSHGWGAAGLEGYVRYILGVKPLLPQYEAVQIKPLTFGPKLTTARGTIPTDRGDISIEWTRRTEDFRIRITLPVNVTAEVHVPATPTDTITATQPDGSTPVAASLRYENGAAIFRIGSGMHEFRVSAGARAPQHP